jgi:drug/metabolite transporter (DMT)-like permease
VALGDRFLLGTHLLPVQVAAVVINLFGCLLSSGVRSPGALVHSPAGLLMGLANGLSFASYTLLGRLIGRTGYRDPLSVLFYIFLFGTGSVLLWGVIAEGQSLFEPRLDAGGWLMVISLAIFPTLVSYALYNSSLRLLPATAASLITTLEPLMVAILALVVLRRVAPALQWVGIALIVAGVMVMHLRMQIPGVRAKGSSEG